MLQQVAIAIGPASDLAATGRDQFAAILAPLTALGLPVERPVDPLDSDLHLAQVLLAAHALQNFPDFSKGSYQRRNGRGGTAVMAEGYVGCAPGTRPPSRPPGASESNLPWHAVLRRVDWNERSADIRGTETGNFLLPESTIRRHEVDGAIAKRQASGGNLDCQHYRLVARSRKSDLKLLGRAGCLLIGALTSQAGPPGPGGLRQSGLPYPQRLMPTPTR